MVLIFTIHSFIRPTTQKQHVKIHIKSIYHTQKCVSTRTGLSNCFFSWSRVCTSCRLVSHDPAYFIASCEETGSLYSTRLPQCSARQFSSINISHGRGATRLRCGEMFSRCLVVNLAICCQVCQRKSRPNLKMGKYLTKLCRQFGGPLLWLTLLWYTALCIQGMV